jgi:hypothetical protein
LGGKPATAPYVGASQLFTFLYFLYFLLIIPVIPSLERKLITEYHQNYLILNNKINSGKSSYFLDLFYFCNKIYHIIIQKFNFPVYKNLKQ